MTDNAGNHGLPSATQAQRRSRILIVALGAALLSAAVWVWYGRSHEKGGDLATPENIRPAGTPGPSSAGRLAKFEDVAASAGLDFKMNFLAAEQGENFKVNLYDHGCGLAIADFDGDGHDDLFLINQLGANVLYRNRGDGTFKRASDDASPLALADRICVGAAFGDYDNDGDPDLYVTSTRGGNVLLENDGGQFRDVTEKSGAALVAHSQTPAFFDYDNDGDLDLYVTNVARWTSDEFNAQDRYFVGPLFLRQFLEGSAEDLEYNVLFQNDGQGHFTDVTREAGLESLSWSGDLAVFDYDGDGWLDVFVTNMFGRSQLYHNDHQGHFRDVTREALRRTSFGAIGAKAFDYDNDGRLDLFVSDMHSDMLDLPKQSSLVEERKKLTQLPGPWRQMLMRQAGEDFAEVLLFGNALYRNQGEGAFVECSDAAGLETFWPWGVAVGDFDNDGDQDLFLPSGMGYPFFYWPNYLMLNNGQGAFVNVTDRSGIEPPADGRYLPETIGGEKAARSSRCAATADFDGDGRLDLVVNNFNDRPYYFKNQTAGGHYVAFRLRGTQSNRDAVGAVVQLRIGGAILVRQVDCAGGYLSQSSQTLHFGLGDVDQLETIDVRWPSGLRQTLGPFEVDRLHQLVEPADNSAP